MTYDENSATRCTTTWDVDQSPGTIQCFREAGHDDGHAPTREIAEKMEEQTAR